MPKAKKTATAPAGVAGKVADKKPAATGETACPGPSGKSGTYRWKSWLGPAVLLALTLLLFGDVLDGKRVLSQIGTDIYMGCLGGYQWLYSELGKGNFALWDPNQCSGIVSFGMYSTGYLYPPYLLYLLLPTAQAINVVIALHIFLLGLNMYYWACYRGLHKAAAVLAGGVMMFGGTVVLHIYAGHPEHICTMAWVPLLFLAIDGLFDSPRKLKWCLLGIGVVALLLVICQPQYVFYTSVAAGLYWCVRIFRAQKRLLVTAGCAMVFLGGALIAAVQQFTGFSAGAENVRSGGVSYDYAAMFSFPPENLLTLIAPGFFGNMVDMPYWGRCFLWEMCGFISVTGLVLAIIGAVRGARAGWTLAIMAGAMVLLALGSHMPWFRFFYDHLPVYNKLRGNSKFIFQATLFLSLLAGVGMDRLLRMEWNRLRLSLCVMGGAVAVAIGGVILLSAAGETVPSWWRGIFDGVQATRESYLRPEQVADPRIQPQAALGACHGLFVAAGTLAVLAILLFASRFSRGYLYGVILLALVEIFVFAVFYRATFDPAKARAPVVSQFLKERPGEYRVLNTLSHTQGVFTGVGDIWGNGPSVLRRYAQFMYWTQDPDAATEYLGFRHLHKLYRMLRLKYVFFLGPQGLQVSESPDPLPRLKLVYQYAVHDKRQEIFAAMARDDFDPAKTVILETPPSVNPQPPLREEANQVRLVDSTTDQLTIEADLATPAILLITDGYARDWRARALPGSSQSEYQLLPANYVLRAVPLQAGHHSLRVEYLPRAFVIGRWISIMSLLVYLGVCAGLLIRHARRRRAAAAPSSPTAP